MPGMDYYAGLDLPEAIRRLADHHFAEENRHISGYEYDLLEMAADELDRLRSVVRDHDELPRITDQKNSD